MVQMVQCKYCLHYKYLKRIECCRSHGEIQLGRCTLSERETGREYGCMTEAESMGCPEFMKAEWKYSKGDVFIRGDRVIAVVRIQEEYAPSAYRVRDNWQSEYSLSEKDLDECEMLYMCERFERHEHRNSKSDI